MFTTGMLFPQDRYRLARIMIAVVKEKYNFAADFPLKLSGRYNFGIEKSFWKKTARLLSKTDDRRGHFLKLQTIPRKWFAAILD